MSDETFWKSVLLCRPGKHPRRAGAPDYCPHQPMWWIGSSVRRSFQFYTGGGHRFRPVKARAVLERKQSVPACGFSFSLPARCNPSVSSTGAIFSRNDRGGGADGVDLLSCYQLLASILGGRRSHHSAMQCLRVLWPNRCEDAAFLKKRAEEYCLKLIYLVDRPPKRRRVNCVLLHTDPNDLPKRVLVKRCKTPHRDNHLWIHASMEDATPYKRRNIWCHSYHMLM